MRKRLLEGLTEAQLSEEKSLRKKVIEEFKNYHKSRIELGRLLVDLHDGIIGEKNFKEYLDALGIPRSSAYRWMDAYRQISPLPDGVVAAAQRRKIDLGLGKYQSAVKELPLPENPTSAETREWLDAVEAKCKLKNTCSSQSSKPANLSAEERSQATSKAYLKHCREMVALTAELWGEVPAAERDVKVAQGLMGPVAAELGIPEPFTVVPDPDPAGSNWLILQLEAMAAEQEAVEEKVAA